MMRSILLKLSNSPGMARWVTTHKTTRRMSERFVAGAHLDQAVAAARVCNQNGLKVSLDLLGESVSNAEEARRAREAYFVIFDRIAEEKLDANVSIKLTQLGLDLDRRDLPGIPGGAGRPRCRVQQFRACRYGGVRLHAAHHRSGEKRRAKTPAVGVVVQAYLRRTEKDVQALIAAGCRMRLCKGAYKEPATVAFPDKSDVDANYVRLMQTMLPSGIYHGIATHDPNMIDATKRFVAEKGVSKQAFEFQMLYGIRTDLQQQLVREGYNMRVYIPYGSDWFPYFMRRLAERPANLLFFAKNLFRG